MDVEKRRNLKEEKKKQDGRKKFSFILRQFEGKKEELHHKLDGCLKKRRMKKMGEFAKRDWGIGGGPS